MDIIIVGGGLAGSTLAGKLSKDGHNVTLVEQSAAKAREYGDQIDARVIQGNGATAPVLRNAGVEDADLLVAMTDSDESNMTIGLVGATLFKVPRVVVRVRDPAHAEGFRLIGHAHPGEHVSINPEAAAVDRIFSLLEVPGALDVVSFLEGRLLVVGFRIQATSDFVGLSISHMRLLFPATPTIIAAIERGDRWIIPHGEEEIHEGDLAYFAIAREELDGVLELIGAPREKVQRVMIAGADRIGLELARRLEDGGFNVTLVEDNLENARKAEESLQKTTVLHGQVTDRALLEEEDIRGVSTFVAVTRDDEVNLVSSLLARRLGAKRTFALVDNPALADLIGEVGIDAVISPRLLAVGLTLQHIRRGRVRSAAALLEDEVEVIEAEALEGSRLTKKKLADIVLPRGTLVAAVLRGDRLLVPGGDDRVEARDRVVIFTTTPKAKHLDEFLSVE